MAALYASALALGEPEATARAMGFAAVVLANVALIIGNRSLGAPLRDLLRPNPALWWIVGGALVALLLAIYVPPAREIFRFDALGGGALAASALPAAVVLAGMLLLAKAMRQRSRR